MMTRMDWRLVEVLASALDAGERQAVFGALAESEESGGRALLKILGLVARRGGSSEAELAALLKFSRRWLSRSVC